MPTCGALQPLMESRIAIPWSYPQSARAQSWLLGHPLLGELSIGKLLAASECECYIVAGLSFFALATDTDTVMSNSISVDKTLIAPNVGVYTDPEHNLYIADAEPSLKQVLDGSSLENGEVTVAIKCSGICG